jgi:hypothetical protein
LGKNTSGEPCAGAVRELARLICVMAQSVIRRIERNLSASAGSNPDQIRPRSVESIKARGHVSAPKGRTHDCKHEVALLRLRRVWRATAPGEAQSLPPSKGESISVYTACIFSYRLGTHGVMAGRERQYQVWFLRGIKRSSKKTSAIWRLGSRRRSRVFLVSAARNDL